MVMVGQARRLRQPLSHAQRVVMAALAVLLTLAFIGVVLYGLLVSDPAATESHGCVKLTFASSTGGQQINKCGAGARRFCLAEADLHGQLARLANPVCARAGYTEPAGAP